MTDITAEALKEKLKTVIEARMKAMAEEKTASVKFIADRLEVKPRQIWRWLEGSTLPHGADKINLALNSIEGSMDLKSDIRSPATQSKHANFPFKIRIPKETLEVTQDEFGDILIRGSLLVDLL